MGRAFLPAIAIFNATARERNRHAIYFLRHVALTAKTGWKPVLRDELLHDLAGDVRESHVATLIAERELEMVESQQVE